MTKQVRDWQKDMELLNQCGDSYMPYKETEFSAMLPYWLQQYAAEKERADNLEQMLDIKMKQLEQVKERADSLEKKIEALNILANSETKQADRWREHVRKSNIELEAAEAREKKLHETLERILKMTNKSEAYTVEARVYHEAFKTLSSLYGEKEDGAK